MCTMKFQMFKLVLEKVEEPEMKLPTSAGSWKNQESSRKTSISALLTMPKPLTVWITINCGKFWKKMGIQDHLICLLRNLYAGQEATVRTAHGTTDWFQIGKGIHQGCILSPCLFNLHAEQIMRNSGLEEVQSGIKTPGRNISNLRYAEDFPGGSDGKASAYNVGDPGSIPGSGRSSGEGDGNQLQYSCLVSSMDRGTWWATVLEVAKSWTWLKRLSMLLLLLSHFSCVWLCATP